MGKALPFKLQVHRERKIIQISSVSLFNKPHKIHINEDIPKPIVLLCTNTVSDLILLSHKSVFSNSHVLHVHMTYSSAEFRIRQ